MDSYANYAGPSTSLIAQPDAVREGVSQFQNSLDRNRAVHAAEVIQKNALMNHTLTHDEVIARTYGQHALMGLRRERNALAQFRRGPGMQSSLIGLEISMGLHEKIDFCDYMGGPSRSERTVDYHVAMEKRMDAMGY